MTVLLDGYLFGSLFHGQKSFNSLSEPLMRNDDPSASTLTHKMKWEKNVQQHPSTHAEGWILSISFIVATFHFCLFYISEHFNNCQKQA